MYEAERDDGSTFPLLSGRIMGGGSSVNNLVVVRPMRRDFEAWQAFGGEAWSYEALLPLMRAVETDRDFADSPLHGADGPLVLHRPFRLDEPADPPVAALLEAAHAFGLPDCPDLNVPEPYGICSSPYNQRNGKRLSTAVAYLDPARGRHNLTIRPETQVTRLLLDGSRVRGVEIASSEGLEVVEADEVVLAAGVYHSPQLLLLSGIGPVADVERVGLTVRHPLDGVGRNYQDHAVVYVTFQGTTDLREDYVIPKVRLIASSDGRPDHPDLHIFMRPSIRMPGLPPMLPVSLHLLEHRTTGRVSLASADPDDLPLVDPGLLRDPDDVRALVDGIGLVDRLTRPPGPGRVLWSAPDARLTGPLAGARPDLVRHLSPRRRDVPDRAGSRPGRRRGSGAAGPRDRQPAGRRRVRPPDGAACQHQPGGDPGRRDRGARDRPRLIPRPALRTDPCYSSRHGQFT